MAKPADSREVRGAEGREDDGPRGLAMLEERSSRLGLGREEGVVREGEAGSFFTLIAGSAPVRTLYDMNG